MPYFCRRLTLLSLVAIFLSVTATVNCRAATAASTSRASLFPSYTVIQNNVRFWEKIYGEYSMEQAVIHDMDDLSKVYTVVRLQPGDDAKARQQNYQLKKDATEKYAAMLTSLAGRAPKTKEERRIAAMFPGSSGRKAMKIAADNIRSQTGQKERFLQGVVNSGRYLTEIRKILKSYGLPEELSYLPHVESSFDTSAYSRLGAAGIWQFTRSTGQQYMTIDEVIDERLDPIQATHAAARYLKDSYEDLNSWPLALTSYNYGRAGMVRAARELGTYEKIFLHYDKGHFKFASRNFYSEFLAAAHVASKLERLPQVKAIRHPAHRYFPLPGYASAHDISRHFRISLSRLEDFNPGLRPPVMTGEKLIPTGYPLRLPATSQTVAQIGSYPSRLLYPQQKASRFHRVQAGETASGIANKYNVSLSSLIRANNLDDKATVFIKQKLNIPVQSTGRAKSESQRKVTKETTRETAPQTDVVTLSARGKTLKSEDPNDSAASQPSSAAITTKELVETEATVATIFPQKKIKLESTANPAATSPKSLPQRALPAKDPRLYMVQSIKRVNGRTYGSAILQPEESIHIFAQWLGVSVSDIYRLNRLNDDSAVEPGSAIHLSFSNITPEQFEEKRLDNLKETEDEFFEAFAVIGKTTYKVNAGDTLWDLCYNKFAIPLWLLERYNDKLDLSQLNISQKLIIPIIQPI